MHNFETPQICARLRRDKVPNRMQIDTGKIRATFVTCIRTIKTAKRCVDCTFYSEQEGKKFVSKQREILTTFEQIYCNECGKKSLYYNIKLNQN